MNRSMTANLALALMVLSAVALVEAMRTHGWESGPGPQPMRDPRIPVLWAVGSQLCLVGGAWLAGFTYAQFKARSILALVLGAMLATWQLGFVL